MNQSPSDQDYPDWFGRCLAAPSTPGETQVQGCPIHYVSWGDPGRPGVVLIHGSNAHLEWWRMIAPMLQDQFHVVAFDLSGSGDSGWRKRYSAVQFASEVMAVAASARMAPRPFVAGHSFGGLVALEAGHLHGAGLSGVVLVDFTIQPPGETDSVLEAYDQKMTAPVRPTRVYPDKASALGRFRLVPEQPCQNPFLVTYLGKHALRQVDGGWTWKFDPGMFRHLDRGDRDQGQQKLLGLSCPAAFIMAETSDDYSMRSVEFTREITAGIAPMFDVPGTRHHLMLDQPVAVAMAIKGVLTAWHAALERPAGASQG
ncbi:MAG: alpha/beta hydrolase [Proteobacteria bacterium]|nr:alpha/beta hydrolase [Pseudomonadota bacterium]MDA1300504.1 alpha/beta hydrolase [Pseudomonadota bacterium]